MKYTDETLMPFGKFKGKKLANVDADYLMWWYRENRHQGHPLQKYIEENLEVLKAQEKVIIQQRKSFNKNLYR